MTELSGYSKTRKHGEESTDAERLLAEYKKNNKMNKGLSIKHTVCEKDGVGKLRKFCMHTVYE